VKAKTTSDYEGQRALTEVLFNSIGEGAVTTDEYGRITRINPIATRILGFSENDALGVWLPKLFVAYDEEGIVIPLIDRPITKAFISGDIITDKIRYKTKDNVLLPVIITISPIMVKGLPIGCIEIFRDITKEYAIDKMKSDFISLASHQLRTPLSTIKTYSHMLIDGYMGDLTIQQSKSLKRIISSTDRMNDTISTLLNITRIESGSIVIVRNPIAVCEVINSVIEDHKLSATNKNIEIKFEKPKNIEILSDGVVLKEVIGNLINNAIKYTPHSGEIRVELKVKSNQIIISVEDNGIGIPEDSQSSIFSKFFRANNALIEDSSGTGLGLYLVKGLVNELGGEVWFDTKKTKGSIFYVSLPYQSLTIKDYAVSK